MAIWNIDVKKWQGVQQSVFEVNGRVMDDTCLISESVYTGL